MEPVRRYLIDFVARYNRPGSVRSYAFDLLRWWRWLRVVDVPWNQATPAEGRDIALWLAATVKGPLIARYDSHERVTGPLLPHLFQRRPYWQPQVMSEAAVKHRLDRTLEATGLRDQAGQKRLRERDAEHVTGGRPGTRGSPGRVPGAPQRVPVGSSGTRDVMHGQHARPTNSSLIGRASTAETSPTGHDGAKHSRRSRRTGRLRRRVLAYRAIDFLSTHIPDDPGPGDECLLLVHTRQVVGQVRYRICTDCAQGLITAVVIDERFQSTGLGTRALSHLRSRHPGLTWRSTLHKRTTRDLLRRMRIPTTTSATPCPHAHQTLSAPAGLVPARG
ncbi:hypothetical protein ABZ770_27125 [Streptomyces sp. NPDC006654]|uniref:hypothetical protein n=1 Tax=Streptomyces sp. NPDC006654 TaxID=3156897 RepID=UPI0033E170D4